MVALKLCMPLLIEETILMSRIPLNSRTTRTMRITRKAGTMSDIAVSQFFFKYFIFSGANMNLMTKSIIKIIQMTELSTNNGGDRPHIKSTISKANHTKPKKTNGPSEDRSMRRNKEYRSCLSAFFCSI